MKCILLGIVPFLFWFDVSHAQPTTYYGTNAGTAGDASSHFGIEAGQFTLAGERYNSYFGYQSGKATTTGGGNTAMGYQSLSKCTSCGENTAIGLHALNRATQSSANTAVGAFSQQLNTTGGLNTSVGHFALTENNTGEGNTAVGFLALTRANASYNTAVGTYSLQSNNGSYNTALGYKAMGSNASGVAGHFNAAFGANALLSNETGSLNSAFGMNAGPSSANLTNTTALGNSATTTASNQVRIGNSSVTSIGGKVSWSTLSDGRFKKDIREDVSGLEFINQLRPVSYTIDEQAVNKFLRVGQNTEMPAELRTKPVRQTGFVAQEVEAVIRNTGFVFHGVEAPQNDNDHYSIRYAEFVVPLVKAVQELTKEVEMLRERLDIVKPQVGNTTPSFATLDQNSPNPFSNDTEISMTLPESSRSASIIIYNLEGKQLKVIPVGGHGKTSVRIQRNEMSAGMYIYALLVDGKVIESKKMVLTSE